jgi:hypothetical protein
MKVQIKDDPRRGVYWSTDAGVCIASATSTNVEVAEYAPARVRDAAHAAGRDSPRTSMPTYATTSA